MDVPSRKVIPCLAPAPTTTSLLFALTGYVYRFAPGFSIVFTFHDHELERFAFHQNRVAILCLSIGGSSLCFLHLDPLSICPVHSAHHTSIDPAIKMAPVFLSTKDICVRNTIEFFRQSAPGPHIDSDLHGQPGITTIGTATYANINIALQIATTFTAYIIDSQ